MTSLPEEIPEWARNCPSGKQKFTTADEARRLFRIESRRGPTKSKFKGTPHVYQCPICSAFHFTSAARRRDGRKFRSPWPQPPEEST